PAIREARPGEPAEGRQGLMSMARLSALVAVTRAPGACAHTRHRNRRWRRSAQQTTRRGRIAQAAFSYAVRLPARENPVLSTGCRLISVFLNSFLIIAFTIRSASCDRPVFVGIFYS